MPVRDIDAVMVSYNNHIDVVNNVAGNIAVIGLVPGLVNGNGDMYFADVADCNNRGAGIADIGFYTPGSSELHLLSNGATNGLDFTGLDFAKLSAGGALAQKLERVFRSGDQTDNLWGISSNYNMLWIL